jgi:hypothetical protein
MVSFIISPIKFSALIFYLYIIFIPIVTIIDTIIVTSFSHPLRVHCNTVTLLLLDIIIHNSKL